MIYLAFWLYAKQDVLDSVKFGLLPLAGILGLIAGLIMAQPDFSAVLTIVLMGGIMFFIGGGNIRQIIVVLLVVMVIGSALIFLYPTAHTRVSDFVAGLQDPQNASYQTQRSIEAIVKGGFWGVGIGMQPPSSTVSSCSFCFHLCGDCGRIGFSCCRCGSPLPVLSVERNHNRKSAPDR